MAYRTTALRIDRDQALRERIISAALARVAEGGFVALTMQALAEDVGIATGSLYRHVRNKGELAAEVFAVASQREVDALAAIVRWPWRPVQRLTAGLERFAARAWDSRQLAFALIAEPVDPRSRRTAPVLSRSLCRTVCRVAARGRCPWRIPRAADQSGGRLPGRGHCRSPGRPVVAAGACGP